MIDGFVAFKWNLEDFIKILYLPVRADHWLWQQKHNRVRLCESEPDKLFTNTRSRPNQDTLFGSACDVSLWGTSNWKRTIPRVFQTNKLSHSAHQEMQENVKKCKNFLATLIKLASHNSPSPETSRNVKALVQDLLVRVPVLLQKHQLFLEMFEKGLVLHPQYNLCFGNEFWLICFHPALIISSSCSLHVFFPVHTQIQLNICCRSSQDAKIDPEEFTSRLQSELKSSPQPYLVPFLKVR